MRSLYDVGKNKKQWHLLAIRSGSKILQWELSPTGQHNDHDDYNYNYEYYGNSDDEAPLADFLHVCSGARIVRFWLA